MALQRPGEFVGIIMLQDGIQRTTLHEFCHNDLGVPAEVPAINIHDVCVSNREQNFQLLSEAFKLSGIVMCILQLFDSNIFILCLPIGDVNDSKCPFA